jgi:hypothetical protein
MKTILALSSALLILLGTQGSAGILRCGFDDGDQGWVSSGSRLSWQRFGGDPGGFLQAETSGGVSSITSPRSWSGDWSRYLGGVLRFHERLIAADGTDLEGGVVMIMTSSGTILTTSAPPLERFWTVREVIFNATNFGVSEAELRRAMRSVASISISYRGTGKITIVGIDEIAVGAYAPLSEEHPR